MGTTGSTLLFKSALGVVSQVVFFGLLTLVNTAYLVIEKPDKSKSEEELMANLVTRAEFDKFVDISGEFDEIYGRRIQSMHETLMSLSE